jgi:uncharacterized OB-fold protein
MHGETMTQLDARPTLRGIGPLPQPDELTRPFWEACRAGRLVLQRCADCRTFQHPPEIICHACLSEHLVWEEVARTGTIYTAVNVTHQVYPNTQHLLPYNVVVVEVDGTGIRLFGNVLGAAFEDIAIGAPVRLVWDQVTDDVVLPRWALT